MHFWIPRPQVFMIQIVVTIRLLPSFISLFQLMSLPNLGSFRCYSSSFIGKGCTRIKGRAILGRSLHNDAISRVGYANAFIAKSTSDDNQINRPDPLAFGHDGPFIKRALVRRQKKEDVSSGFSSSDKYRISGDIRPEQVLYVKALNGNLIPEDFVRTIGTGAPAYIRGLNSNPLS
jgi:hypothetical protein